MRNIFVLIIIFTAAFCGSADAQISLGGNYALEQAVIATGGSSNSTGGNYKVEGTIGQSAAGKRSNGSALNLQNGFWTAPPLAPTAATVSIGGRVTTIDGRGIRNAIVTLTSADGTTRTVLTEKLGEFNFTEIEIGQTIIVSVISKRFVFAAPTQTIPVAEDTNEIRFITVSKAILKNEK